MDGEPRMRNRRKLAVLALTVAALTVPQFAVAGPPASQVTVKDDSFAPARPGALNFGGSFSLEAGAGRCRRAQRPPGRGALQVREPDQDQLHRGPPATRSRRQRAATPTTATAHRAQQMVGKIKVRPIVEPGTLGSRSFGVQWASRTNKETGTRFDVRYQVGGKWKAWKNDTASFHGTFGKHRRPVRVKPRHTYKIEVAVGAAPNTSKKSDWSPALSVKTSG